MRAVRAGAVVDLERMGCHAMRSVRAERATYPNKPGGTS